MSTLSLLEEGETSRLTTNSILSASLRLCWNSSSPSWWFIIITKRHRVIHPSCVVTVDTSTSSLLQQCSNFIHSSIYHCSSSAMQQHLSILSFITDLPIHQLYLPISSSIASYPNHEVELAYHCLASLPLPFFFVAIVPPNFFYLKERQFPPSSCKRQSCTCIRLPCFLPRHHYFLPAIALHKS